MHVSDNFLRQLYLPFSLRKNGTCSVENCRSSLTYAVFWFGKSPFLEGYNLVYDLRASCLESTHLLEAARNTLYGEYDFILDLRSQKFLDTHLEKQIKDQLILEGFFKGY